ncbi:MAG: NAD(P)-dependent oxidoreductase [Prevotellaceae bacterium]|jgi:UDP-glucose 4-epimerase|nr:NAD(P)-dependent oxidoreductase [Prevotellaceae bacterium]
MAKTILITGASGFIGSFIVEEALRLKYNVWAGIRTTSNRKYLKHKKLHFLELDFAHPSALRTQLAGYKGTYSKFDYIVHCAGITKAARHKDFDQVNFLQTKCFVDTLRELNMIPRQFIYLSSLSVYGPIHKQNDKPISENDNPFPDTWYGMSKLKAELYIRSISGFPYVILRPTGVYGPREQDYYILAKSIKRHVDLSVGFRKQALTFVYVKDVVSAVFRCIEKDIYRRCYFLADGDVHDSRDFSRLIRKELGNPLVLHIRIPLWLVRIVASLNVLLSRKPTTLNPDKYKILRQRNWRCDITPAQRELEYEPAYTLAEGVAETIKWYKEEGWL